MEHCPTEEMAGGALQKLHKVAYSRNSESVYLTLNMLILQLRYSPKAPSVSI